MVSSIGGRFIRLSGPQVVTSITTGLGNGLVKRKVKQIDKKHSSQHGLCMQKSLERSLLGKEADHLKGLRNTILGALSSISRPIRRDKVGSSV